MMQTVEKENRIWMRRYPHIPALLLVALTASVPLMTRGCTGGVNAGFYLRQLEKVCWEDIFLLLPSLLVRAGARAELVYRLLLLGLNLATSAAAYLSFRGIFRDRLTGLVGSMLYTWAPYRLNDLYCRADLGEAIALCFLPVICYGLYRTYHTETDAPGYRHLWIVLTLGYTLLVQAYLLSFLVAAGFTVLYCLAAWKRTFRRPVLFVLLKTVLAFVLCNAWLFLLLFLRMRSGAFSMTAFRGDLIQSGGVYPSAYLQLFFLHGSSFRTVGTGTENIQPMGVGFAVTVGVLAYLWLVFVGRYRDRPDEDGIRRFGRELAVTGAVVAAMTMNWFPWDYLQKRNGVFFRLVASLQSPARLMPVVLLCLTAAVCAAVSQVRKWEMPSVGMTFVAVLAVTAFMTTQYLNRDILDAGRIEITSDAEREELDISPWDYGKYESAGSGAPTLLYGAEAVSVLTAAGAVIALCRRRKCARNEDILRLESTQPKNI